MQNRVPAIYAGGQQQPLHTVRMDIKPRRTGDVEHRIFHASREMGGSGQVSAYAPHPVKIKQDVLVGGRCEGICGHSGSNINILRCQRFQPFAQGECVEEVGVLARADDLESSCPFPILAQVIE